MTDMPERTKGHGIGGYGETEFIRVDIHTAAIARAEKAEAAMKWQPIETAPKDGTPVVVGWDRGFWHPIIAHQEGKFWGVLGPIMDFTILQVKPTHWMPLPAPPTP